MHQAASRGRSEEVRSLLQGGADTLAADRNGMSPLCAACAKGHVEVVRLLLAHRRRLGDDACCLEDAAPLRYISPLHAAAAKGRTEIARELLAAKDERAIREASYDAVATLQRASGRSMGAVDWFFFQNRRRCPEMSEPDCRRCAVDAECAHQTALFQPVLRTAFY